MQRRRRMIISGIPTIMHVAFVCQGREARHQDEENWRDKEIKWVAIAGPDRRCDTNSFSVVTPLSSNVWPLFSSRVQVLGLEIEDRRSKY